MGEKLRTVVLVIVLALIIAFVVWSDHQSNSTLQATVVHAARFLPPFGQVGQA